MKSVKRAVHRLTGAAGVNYRLERTHEAINQELARLRREVEHAITARIAELEGSILANTAQRLEQLHESIHVDHTQLRAGVTEAITSRTGEMQDQMLREATQRLDSMRESIRVDHAQLRAGVTEAITSRTGEMQDQMLREATQRLDSLRESIREAIASRAREIQDQILHETKQRLDSMRESIRVDHSERLAGIAEAIANRIGEMRDHILRETMQRLDSMGESIRIDHADLRVTVTEAHAAIRAESAQLHSAAAESTKERMEKIQVSIHQQSMRVFGQFDELREAMQRDTSALRQDIENIRLEREKLVTQHAELTNEVQSLRSENEKLAQPVSKKPKNQRIGFIHLPKTGGTSVAQTLINRYADRAKSCAIYEFANYYDQLSRMTVLTGHVPFYLFSAEPRIRRLYTVLRNPEDRAVSTYRFILSSPHHYAYPYVTGQKLTLAQCFEHPFLSFELVNLQTRMLGWSTGRDIVLPVRSKKHYSLFLAAHASYYYDEVDRTMLATAIERLSSVVSFGVLDDPQSVIKVVRSMMGADQQEVPWYNKTPDTEYEVTAADREAIQRNNTLDRELHEFALAHTKRIHRSVQAPIRRRRRAMKKS